MGIPTTTKMGRVDNPAEIRLDISDADVDKTKDGEAAAARLTVDNPERAARTLAKSGQVRSLSDEALIGLSIALSDEEERRTPFARGAAATRAVLRTFGSAAAAREILARENLSFAQGCAHAWANSCDVDVVGISPIAFKTDRASVKLKLTGRQPGTHEVELEFVYPSVDLAQGYYMLRARRRRALKFYWDGSGSSSVDDLPDQLVRLLELHYGA